MGAAARFSTPEGLALDPAGNILVADSGNASIRKITPEGVVTTLAGSSSAGGVGGMGASAQFRSPSGVAVDGAGNVFVADTGGNSIRKITPLGVVTTVVGGADPTRVGNFPDPLPASIYRPLGVAVVPSGEKLYLTVRDAVMVAVF